MNKSDQLKEIENKIYELEKQRTKLKKIETDEFLESAKENVGRCFKANGVYVKVLDVPQYNVTMTGTYLNEYQYPAIFLKKDDDYPFVMDTLFSGAWGVGRDILGKYEEVSSEEFDAEFDKCMNEFINTIKNTK